MKSPHCVSFLLVLLLFSNSLPLQAQQQGDRLPVTLYQKFPFRLDNYTAAYVDELLRQRDLTEFSNQLAADPPVSEVNPVFQFLLQMEVYLRAGQTARAAKAIEDKGPSLKQYDNRDDLLRLLIQRGEIPLAVKLVEACPLVSLRGDKYEEEKIVKYLASVKSVNETDAWLESVGWFDARLRFRFKQGTAGPLLEALKEEVKKHPADGQLADDYWVKTQNYLPPGANDWMAEVCQPALAYNCYLLAHRMQAPKAKRVLLELALTRPFTKTDESRMQMVYQMTPLNIHDWNQLFQARVKKALAETYLVENQPAMAQKLMEEVAVLKPKDVPLDELGRTAGMVQLLTGQRVIEQSIKNNEAAYRDYPQYWIERVHYYEGRDEDAAVKETYEKALAHFPLDKKKPEGYGGKRLHILQYYARWLADKAHSEERQKEKARWLKEFTSVPPESDYAYEMYDFLIRSGYREDLAQFWQLPDGHMWRILAKRPVWNGGEGYEVAHQYRLAVPETRIRLVQVLDSIAKQGTPSKTFAIAELYQEEGRYPESIRLWKTILAVESRNSQYGEASSRRLFEAYLKTGDWKAGEALILEESGRKPMMERLENLALAVAHKGDKPEVLRLWAFRNRLDRCRLEALPKLAEAGLRQPLIDFYLAMKKEDPHSTIPDRALKLLQN